jgi:hypothetical protein
VRLGYAAFKGDPDAVRIIRASLKETLASITVRHDLAGETIPLFAAAAVAYEQVFSARRTDEVAPSVDRGTF